MSRYLLLQKAGPGPSTAIGTIPSLGSEALATLIESNHGNVLEHYILLGQYDSAIIVEFESDLDALAYSLEAGAGDLYTETLIAFKPDEVEGILERSTFFGESHAGYMEELEAARSGSNQAGGKPTGVGIDRGGSQ